MPTIGEWKRVQADRFAKEQQAMVNVIQARMEWHLRLKDDRISAEEKAAHEELLKRDAETLEEIASKYQHRQDHYQRQNTPIPPLKLD